MALHDEILIEIIARKIPVKFRAADLRTREDPKEKGRYFVGSKSYSLNSITTILPNRSITPDGSEMGDSVQEGQSATFYRLGNGTYQLIASVGHTVDLEERFEMLEGSEGDNESILSPRTHDESDEIVQSSVYEASALSAFSAI